MKRILYILMCLAVIAAGTGCGTNERAAGQQTAAAVVIQEETEQPGGDSEKQTGNESALSSSAGSNIPEPNTGASEATAEEGIDIDLTSLSSTMVYSQVYLMMTAPEEYIGKTIKIKGSYLPYTDERTGNSYFTCIIQDAAACCAQGIEFLLNDDYQYPDDYPEEGSQITVVGVFDTYLEDNFMYYTLRNAYLES